MKPVLYIGTPRSGTNNLKLYLRSLGLKVAHENVGQDYEILDAVVDYHQLLQLKEWPIKIYLTREPLANVNSLAGLLKRKGQYKRTLALEPFAALPKDVDPAELAARYWLYVYGRCRRLPRLRAEDVPVMDEKRDNTDHQEGSAHIASGPWLGALLRAGRDLGYYTDGGRSSP